LQRAKGYDALPVLHLRWKKWERQFWIDALCISQEDVSERNHQVRVMEKIYSQAQGVVAWLGRAQKNGDPVMRHLNGIGDIHDPARDSPSSLLDNVKKAFNKSTALEKWCNRTYWQRMWIVQEIMLNHQVTLCCGTISMPMNFFDEARKYIVSKLHKSGAVYIYWG
jgi:hypothetical protein